MGTQVKLETPVTHRAHKAILLGQITDFQRFLLYFTFFVFFSPPQTDLHFLNFDSLSTAILPPQIRGHAPLSVTPPFTPAPWHRAGKITLAPSWQQNLLREQNKMKGSFFSTDWGLLGENKRLGETCNWGRT